MYKKNTAKGDTADGGKILPILWSFDNTYHAYATPYRHGMITDNKLFYVLSTPHRSGATTTDAVNKALVCQRPEFDMNKSC